MAIPENTSPTWHAACRMLDKARVGKNSLGILASQTALDQAICKFAHTYADQNEADYANPRS